MTRIRIERRERLALDDAYAFYRQTIHDERQMNLHGLVNSLKIVATALRKAEEGHFKLTTRLWMRIEQALFDKLLTTYPAYVVVTTPNGRALEPHKELPEDGTVELHPEGLKRNDDVFAMAVQHLHPLTRRRLNKVWLERGPITRREDFANLNCADGVCSINNTFIAGQEILEQEASNGKRHAMEQWWELYWQKYCTPDKKERQTLARQMAALESVWGDLHQQRSRAG